MDDDRQALLKTVKDRGYLRLEEPVQLSSGEYSRDFVDVKRALARGEDLERACRAMVGALERDGIDFDVVGGLTMGADQFAHVVAVLAQRSWFTVRKAPKGRGTNKRVEGASVGQGTRVVLVDEVVTTGGSIREAYDVITEAGASIVAALTLLDRGEVAAPFFARRAVPYRALLTYRDLGIEPVGGGLVSA